MTSRVALCMVCAASVLTFSAVALAESTEAFQNELGFSYGHMSDGDNTFDTTTIQFDVVHFLQPVTVANHPLAEAAFLERAASISFLLNQATTDIFDRTIYSAKLDYASTTSPLTLTAAYTGYKVTFDDSEGDISTNEYGFKVGSYVGDAGRLQAVFSQVDVEDTTITRFGIDAKFVNELGNDAAIAINGTILSAESDSTDSSSSWHGYKLDVDYYTSRMTNIGFTRVWETSEDQDGSYDRWAHSIRIKHFLSPQASIAFEYMISDETDSDSATDGFNVKFSMRI
ncbi:MAG: hypothetical protein HY273_15725 [Gammaproteobacteria bacterium]|nr:hypothetical protein [Gammaproteobacteria bacterium]